MTTSTRPRRHGFRGNDRLLFGMILGVLAFWLFAQTTLNIASTMATDLGIEMSVMNIAVSITALFSGIFIVVVGGARRSSRAREGRADRLRLRHRRLAAGRLGAVGRAWQSPP